MKRLLILAILLLGDLSVAQSQDLKREEAQAQAILMKTVGKQTGNFLVVRTFENAVISFRVLLKNMKNIQDNVFFDDSGPESLSRVKDMMVKSLDLKVKFETTVSGLLGGMMTIDTHIAALGVKAIVKSSDSARKQLSLDASMSKVQTLKKMLDKEVMSTCDEYANILKDWSGAEVFTWMKAEVAKIDGEIENAEKNVETLSQKRIQAEIAEAANLAKAAESSAMLRWVQKQDDIAEDERKWNQNMQFTKMAMDSASGALSLVAGPISLLNFGSKKEPAEMPPREKADILTPAERAAQTREAHKGLHEAKNKMKLLARQVKDAEASVRKAHDKLRKLEAKRADLERQLGQRVKDMGAVNADHAKTIIESVSSFFFQKKNLMAMAATIESFNTFIKGWHETWQAYDKMKPLTRALWLQRLADNPMGWGVVAPEIWSAVQAFPDLLDAFSRDPFHIPDESTAQKVPTYRESVNAFWAAREDLLEKANKAQERTDL